jgi:hypothetical protein
MSLLSKVNMCLIMIAMAFAMAPTATYAAAYIKFDGIGGKIPGMRVTDKTTVHEVAVFAARYAGVDVGCISLNWIGAAAAEQLGNQSVKRSTGAPRRTKGPRVYSDPATRGTADDLIGNMRGDSDNLIAVVIITC